MRIDHGEELEEPDDRNHGTGNAARAQRLEVPACSQGLETVEVEVDERYGRKRPGARNGTRRRLEARNKTEHVANENEEEQSRQERDVLLETMPDDVFRDVAINELVAVFDHIVELVGRNELQLPGSYEDHQQRDEKGDEQPDVVLRDVPASDAEYGLGLKMRGQALGLSYKCA